MRRGWLPLGGIAALLLVAVAGAGPASADPPTLSWTDPAPTAVPGEGTPVGLLRHAQQLQGVAEHAGGIDSISFSLVTDGAPPGDPCSAAGTARPQLVPGRGERQVAFAFDATFPCNLAYVVAAQVTPSISPSHGRSDITRLQLRLLVSIPPADITGLRADATATSIFVHWDPATGPAPDFEGFEVRRAIGDGPLREVSSLTPDTASYLDSDVTPGVAYRYEVVGVRNGPQPATVVYSATPAVAQAELAPSAAATGAGGGGARGTPAAGRSTATTLRRSPPTTADTGFSAELPFKPRPARIDPASGSAIARLGGEDQSGETTRQTMILVAGGMDMLAGAMVLRFVARRAAAG